MWEHLYVTWEVVIAFEGIYRIIKRYPLKPHLWQFCENATI